MITAMLLALLGVTSIAIARQIHRPVIVADFVFVSGCFALWLAILAIGVEVVA